jgi:hypothetical protein
MAQKVGGCCVKSYSKCGCLLVEGKCCSGETCVRELTKFEKRIAHYTKVYLDAVSTLNRLRWLRINRKITVEQYQSRKAAQEAIRENAANKLLALKEAHIAALRLESECKVSY